MSVDNQIYGLLRQDFSVSRKTQTLIFTLGEKARHHIEYDLKSSPGILSSVKAIVRIREDIAVLFLNRLQYLFMYLMKFEAEEAVAQIKYNHFIIYGLDTLLEEINSEEDSKIITGEQLRLSSLIFNAAFRIKRKYTLQDVLFIPVNSSSDLARELSKLEDYWRHIC